MISLSQIVRAMAVSAATAAIAEAGVSRDGVAVCKTCKGPKFSWDTMPVAFHCSEEKTNALGQFSEEEMETIAKFPLVTIEKWQGVQALDASGSPVFLWEEDAMLASARAIKSKRPDTSVVVWFDSMRIYTGWNFPPGSGSGVNHTLNPSAGSACSTGHFRPAEFLETHPNTYIVQNSSGYPALEPWSKCHMYAFEQQPSQEFWRDMCLNMTASGVIDGCGADASWQVACQPPADAAPGQPFNCTAVKFGMDAQTAYDWDRGKHAALRATTAAVGDGMVLGKDPGEILTPEVYGESSPYVNGVLHEGCSNSNETVMTLRNLTEYSRRTGRRVVYECHQSCKPPANETCVDYAAAFLAGAGEQHYFVTGGWETADPYDGFADHWIPGLFDQPLGEPLSDAVYDPSSGEWHRAFASGTKVVFNAVTKKGSITWGRSR